MKKKIMGIYFFKKRGDRTFTSTAESFCWYGVGFVERLKRIKYMQFILFVLFGRGVSECVSVGKG